MSVSYSMNYNQNYVNPYGNPKLDKYVDDVINETQAALYQPTNSYQNYPSSSQNKPNGCTDGKDDGKIGIWEGIKNAGKGMFNMVVNTVKDIATDPKKLLMAVGTAALTYACPPVGLVLAGAGLVSGGITLVKGINTAMNATTDAEAKAAWQDIGAGGLTVGLSVAGAKASVKSMSSSSAIRGRLVDSSGKVKLTNIFKDNGKFKPVNGMKEFGKAMWKDTKNSRLGQGVKNFSKNLKADADDLANQRIDSRIKDLEKSGIDQLDDSIDIDAQRSELQKNVDDLQKKVDNSKAKNVEKTKTYKELQSAKEKLEHFDNSVEYKDLNTLKDNGGVKAGTADYKEVLKSKIPSKSKVTLENIKDIEGLSSTDKSYLSSAIRQGEKIDVSKLSQAGQAGYKEFTGSSFGSQIRTNGTEFLKNNKNAMFDSTKQILPFAMSQDDSSQEYLREIYG